MDLGIFDHLDRRDMPLADFYEHRLRLLEKYDAAGFYSYHLAEHHATPLGLAPVPGLFLAAATQRTRRIRLGPCVYCLPLYNPLRLIEEVCMLDHLSRGRFDFGVGRGIVPYEMAFFDLHHLETEDIYRETLEIVLQGLTSDAGNPLPSSSAAISSRRPAAPADEIRSACSADSAQVSEAAGGVRPGSADVLARLRRYCSRYSRHDSGELAITAAAWRSARGS